MVLDFIASTPPWTIYRGRAGPAPVALLIQSPVSLSAACKCASGSVGNRCTTVVHVCGIADAAKDLKIAELVVTAVSLRDHMVALDSSERHHIAAVATGK